MSQGSHMRFDDGTVRGVPYTNASQYLDAADFDARSTRTMTQVNDPQPLLGNIPEAERSMRIDRAGLGDLYDPQRSQYGPPRSNAPLMAEEGDRRYGAGQPMRREMNAAEFGAGAHAQGYGRFNTE